MRRTYSKSCQVTMGDGMGGEGSVDVELRVTVLPQALMNSITFPGFLSLVFAFVRGACN